MDREETQQKVQVCVGARRWGTWAASFWGETHLVSSLPGWPLLACFSICKRGQEDIYPKVKDWEEQIAWKV